MKKDSAVAGIFFLMIILASIFVTAVTPTCSDSDGGMNYIVKGTVSGVTSFGQSHHLRYFA
jgi:hypothetical protein